MPNELYRFIGIVLSSFRGCDYIAAVPRAGFQILFPDEFAIPLIFPALIRWRDYFGAEYGHNKGEVIIW